MLTVEGIVLKERSVGETDKYSAAELEQTAPHVVRHRHTLEDSGNKQSVHSSHSQRCGGSSCQLVMTGEPPYAMVKTGSVIDHDTGYDVYWDKVVESAYLICWDTAVGAVVTQPECCKIRDSNCNCVIENEKEKYFIPMF